MPLTGLVERLRRASRRSPGYLVARLKEMVASRLRRPWSRIYPHLVTADSVARAAGAPSVDALWRRQQEAPFFLNLSHRQEMVRVFRERFPDSPEAVVAAADRVLRHEFDLLGSGPVLLGPSLPWHTDFKTGREWPLTYALDIDYSELDRPSDVKVPWELSRCQHFTALGQAYWLTGDERYAGEFAAEVEDWIARNPVGRGVNWACAMDVALRAVSWIWGFHFMSGSPACASAGFRSAFLRSLYLHGQWIATHIERSDINGNHYLCDGVGLVFLGVFFRETRKGRRWLLAGRGIIAGEIFNQTTDDGVDFEQSTAYHRLVLEAFITCSVLLDRSGEPLPADWKTRLERMHAFVEAYVKPDGTVPLVGDADDGRVQKLGPQAINEHRYLLSTGAVLFGRNDFKRAAGRFWEESFWLLGPDAVVEFDRIGIPVSPIESAAFSSGGFYVLRSERAHVFVDCGEVGMRGRGGHGHNDITSVEIWLDGLNVVTDCGAYLYTASREWRNRFRGTAFHNVVQVDGEELNRFFSPDQLWRLQDDARPRDVEWSCDGPVDYFRGGHSGYERLASPVAVTREIWLVKQSPLVRDSPEVWIRDSVEGDGVHELTWRFHFGSGIAAHLDGSAIRLTSGDRDAWLQLSGLRGRSSESQPELKLKPEFTFTIEKGWTSPGYGVREPIDVGVVTERAILPRTALFRVGLHRLSDDRLEDLHAEAVSGRTATIH